MKPINFETGDRNACGIAQNHGVFDLGALRNPAGGDVASEA